MPMNSVRKPSLYLFISNIFLFYVNISQLIQENFFEGEAPQAFSVEKILCHNCFHYEQPISIADFMILQVSRM